MPKKPNSSNDIQPALFDNLSDSKFSKPQLDRQTEVEFDLAASMKNALDNPLFYPPLKESVFPGDQVAIALQNGLPQPLQLLTSLLENLNAAQIASNDIAVVINSRTAAQLGFSSEQIKAGTDPELAEPAAAQELEIDGNLIKFQIHNGEISKSLSYLLANVPGDPMHVNRVLVDADVILPIGCPSAGEARQQHDCIYPEFASSDVQTRFSASEGSFLSRQEEILLASDTLGAFFAIQVVVGPGDRIHKIVSGARADALGEARTETNRLWEFVWPDDVDAAVATIETHPQDQTWEDFALAVIAASRISMADGPIIVWSDISQRPHRRIRKACLAQFEDSENTKLSRELQHMSAIIKERPIFLRSELARNDVEELGIGFIESADEINRIVESHSNCLLLRDAHKLQISDVEKSV